MRHVGREALKTAAVLLGAAILVGGTVGWMLGDLYERCRQRRAS